MRLTFVRLLLAGTAGILSLAAACAPAQPSDGQQQTPTPSPSPVVTPSGTGTAAGPEAVADVAQANTRFAFDLLGEISSAHQGEDLIFSPFSVSMALAMTYNGAAGETRQVMAETLRLDGLSLEEVNQGSAGLLRALEGLEQVDMRVANSLWAQEGYAFHEDFLQRNRDHFDAEVASLDLGSQQAVDRINGWISASTNGKIPRMLEQADPSIVMYLINALYFKGAWQHPFDEANTEERPFHLADGTERPHPMMHQRGGTYQYLDGEGFQAVRLPYQWGVSMYLFLPDEGASLDGFLAELDAERWDVWMQEFQGSGADLLVLPKFKTELKTDLNQALIDLGMGIAFGGGADFSAMGPGGLFIDHVKHAAVIEVYEEGTEAAAATVVGMTTSAPASSFEFVADRPFFYAITEDKTGSVLFMGTLVDPA
jgi:serpin B